MLCRGSHSVPVPWGTEVCKPQLSMASMPVLLKSNRSSWGFPGTQLSVTGGPLIPWGWSLHAWHTLSIPVGRRPAERHWALRVKTEEAKVKVLVAQSCLTLCNPMDHSCPRNSLGKNTEVGCHFLLQKIFPTQGLKPNLPHCRQILYIWGTREDCVF